MSNPKAQYEDLFKLNNPEIYTKRRIKHQLGMLFSILALSIGLLFLFWILYTLVSKGMGSIALTNFTQDTPGPGMEGGLKNAIIGSVLMVGAAAFISTPIGVLAGVYLAEYGERNWFADFTRFITDIMLSAPSIVIGLFVYAIYVTKVGHFAGWAGSMALSLIAVPVVLRTTDNMLALVPSSLREAAFALGAPRWKVALMVRVKAVKAGIMTGILLAVARMTGETAPLLFTALNDQFTNWDMNKPMPNLPVAINQFATSFDTIWIGLAWAGATLITFSVLTLIIFSRYVISPKKI